MVQRYTNVSGIPLSVAVFLATDNYDYSGEENNISATTLLKPIRQLILRSRLPPSESRVDLTDQMANRVGSAIHDGIERAWLNNHANAMLSMGISQRVVDLIKINPSKQDLIDFPDTIPVYMEERATRKIGKYTISGKYDHVFDGRVEDFKTTTTYKAMSGSSDDDYSMQGSIYRWLSPDKITKDTMAIQYIFTDWSKLSAMQNPLYPQKRFQEHIVPLISVAATENWITNKLALLESLFHVPEEELPLCTDKELWRKKSQYKYYKNPEKTARSTKNFETEVEALTYKAIEGKGVGIVLERPGGVRACVYCAGYSLCSQKDSLIANGDLVL